MIPALVDTTIKTLSSDSVSSTNIYIADLSAPLFGYGDFSVSFWARPNKSSAGSLGSSGSTKIRFASSYYTTVEIKWNQIDLN